MQLKLIGRAQMRLRTAPLLLLILCLHLAPEPLEAADERSASEPEMEAGAPAKPAEFLTVDEKLDRILDLLERLGADDPEILEEIEALRRARTQPREQPEGSEGSVDLLWRTDAAAVPSTPAATLGRWRWRSFGSWSRPYGSRKTGTLEGNRFHFDLGKGTGFGFETERLVGELSASEPTSWGWAVGFSRADLDALWTLDSPDFWIRDSDRVALHALTIGFNHHWRGERWDFFAGPLLALLDLDDATLADGSELPGTLAAAFDRDVVLGATLGSDLLVGEAWGLTASLQYFNLSIDSDPFDLESSLLTSRLGVLFDF